MNSIVDVGDSSQSPRGPWSPVRVNRPHRGLSPVAPPNSDPSSFHAVLADTDSRVDVTITQVFYLCGLDLRRQYLAVSKLDFDLARVQQVEALGNETLRRHFGLIHLHCLLCR